MREKLQTLPVAELRELAKSQGVKGISGMKKSDLIDLLCEKDKAIEEQKKFVEIMVESIDRGYFKTTDDIFDRFKVDLEDYNFTRLVILDKNGNGTTSDGHVVENYPNMQEFFSKEDVYLSENRPSTVSDNQVNIYSKKFKRLHYNKC